MRKSRREGNRYLTGRVTSTSVSLGCLVTSSTPVVEQKGKRCRAWRLENTKWSLLQAVNSCPVRADTISRHRQTARPPAGTFVVACTRGAHHLLPAHCKPIYRSSRFTLSTCLRRRFTLVSARVRGACLTKTIPYDRQ